MHCLFPSGAVCRIARRYQAAKGKWMNYYFLAYQSPLQAQSTKRAITG
ncbi:hypothetical protein CES86_0962 [Brucella lupini]|uniref:Uncharacterized protein n=1 Tax=Brucella lupini TaxID=255457 RepID=A0A256GWE9_9HYPH|nr:hypothetical protein CES86_0962 [Brucella lupini]